MAKKLDQKGNGESIQDFRMRYRVIIDDIKYIKSRQWAVTYYLLLLFAAIISFYHLDGIHPVYHWQEKFLTFIAILVAALGTFYLLEFQYRLHIYRKRIVDVTKRLSEDFKIYEESLHDDIDEYKSYWKGFTGFTLPFILMLWVGMFFTLWGINTLKNIELIPFLENILNSLGYSFIVIGSLGMIFFATKFPSSARIKDLKLHPKRLFSLKWLNGWRVWKWSWILILIGSIIQIILVWMI